MLFKSVTILNEQFDIEKKIDVRIEDGIIKTISQDRLEPLAHERVIDGKHRLLLPGFANVHCHVPMTLLRGRGEGLDLWTWLSTAIFPFEAKMTAADMKIGTRLGLLEMIRSGITTFTDMYLNIDAIADVVRESKMRANLCFGISAGEGTFKERRGVQESLDLLKSLGHNDGRVRVDLGLHAEYTSDEDTVRGVATLAKEYDLIVHTHVSETKNEHQGSIDRHGMTPLAWLKHCGILDNPVIAAHCVFVTKEDLQLMAAADVTPVHCISSNLKLGSGVADLDAWQKAGISYAIGTDGAASNNNLNFFEELHLVSLVHKGVSEDPTFLKPKELLAAATIRGYEAQRRESAGLIKEGYAADLILIDLDKPHLVPANDLSSHLCHSAQAEDVVMTMVGGDVLYEDGEFMTLDAEKIVAEARQATEAILSRI